MRPSERTRLILAFGTLLALTLASRGLTATIGPQLATVVGILMGLGALPALMLHWVHPARAGRPTLVAAALLALPGLGLTLQVWHDWLIARGITPNAPLIGLALVLALVQAVALRADRTTRAYTYVHKGNRGR